MPEPFLPQGMCYCCVQKNLTEFRASFLLGLGTLGIGVGQDSFSGTSCLLLQKTKYEYSA